VHAKCKVGHLAVVHGSAAKKRAAGTQRTLSFK
jgi:carbonic anhydrase/acetyltransferase-like protein (isoleucine patch superfamily)